MNTPYTYLIGWRNHNTWYYGVRYSRKCHPSDLWKTYFTSSNFVKDFRKENGEPDIVQIRKTFSNNAEARKHEAAVIKRLRIVKDSRFLNKANAGEEFYATEKALELAHLANTGRVVTNETREKQSKSAKGRKKTDQHKLRIATSNSGKKRSLQTKENISKSRKGKFLESADHLNQAKYECIPCGITTNKGNFKRWHSKCITRPLCLEVPC